MTFFYYFNFLFAILINNKTLALEEFVFNNKTYTGHVEPNIPLSFQQQTQNHPAYRYYQLRLLNEIQWWYND